MNRNCLVRWTTHLLLSVGLVLLLGGFEANSAERIVGMCRYYT